MHECDTQTPYTALAFIGSHYFIDSPFQSLSVSMLRTIFYCSFTLIPLLYRSLGGEILGMAEPLLNRNFHPTVIVSGYCKALQKALEVCAQICRVIDVDNIKVCH
jgi:hypothetical protein